jgi:hypothetical protein
MICRKGGDKQGGKPLVLGSFDEDGLVSARLREFLNAVQQDRFADASKAHQEKTFRGPPFLDACKRNLCVLEDFLATDQGGR